MVSYALQDVALWLVLFYKWWDLPKDIFAPFGGTYGMSGGVIVMVSVVL